MLKLLSLFGIFLAGCSSVPKGVDHAGEERVISRIDEMGSRPDWLKESEPFRIENGKVLSLGMTTVGVDNANLSAVYRIAQNSAKAGISGAIEQRLDFVFQNAEEGTTLDSTQARYIGAEASKLTTSSLRPSKQYWEKVATVQESGQQVLRYRVFALVEMPETDFKAAIMDAIRRAQGKGGLSQDFAKKVDSHWEKFVNGDKPAEKPVIQAKAE
jgi:hypothetical protein